MAACRSYFDTCEADEVEPKSPYWPKWRHFAVMIESFYASAAGAQGGVFAVGQEWSLFPIDDLNLVVAAMNSTMDVTHDTPDARGSTGPDQEQWFTAPIADYTHRGRISLRREIRPPRLSLGCEGNGLAVPGRRARLRVRRGWGGGGG